MKNAASWSKAALCLALLVFLGTLLLSTPAAAQTGECTPGPTGGCETASPTPPAIAVPPTATPPAVKLPPAPTASPTPLTLGYPPPPEENPFRPTPFGFKAKATLTPTPTLMPEGGLPFPDLSIWAVEVTQGLQNLANDMPLIEGRGTVVRVYVKTDKGSLPDVRAFMEGYRNGQKISAQPLQSSNTVTARPDGGDRIKVEDTLNFYLPAEWRKGDVRYHIFVYAAHPQTPYKSEPNAENNFWWTGEGEISYQPKLYHRVVMVPVHFHDYDNKGNISDIPKTYFFNNNPDAFRIVVSLTRYLPITELIWVSAVNTIYPEEHTETVHKNDWHLANNQEDSWRILERIKNARDNNNVLKNYQWYGMMDSSLPWWHWIDKNEDGDFKDPVDYIFYSGGIAAYGVSFGKMTATYGGTPWFIPGVTNIAHETGHNLGLGHYLCAGNEEDGGSLEADSPYSLQNCNIDPITPKDKAGFFGFDWYYHLWPHLSAPTVITSMEGYSKPNLGYPLMGYKSPQWTDVFTYCSTMNALGGTCDLADLGLASRFSRVAASDTLFLRHAETDKEFKLPPADAYLLVNGTVSSDAPSARFLRAAKILQPTDNMIASAAWEDEQVKHLYQVLGDSPFSLTLETAAGEPLYAVQLFDVSSPHVGDGEANPTFLFSKIIPYAEDARFIRVRAGDKVLAERRISANPPVVELLTQNDGGALSLPLEITWKASDPDGDRLSYMLEYSPDGGQTWTALETELYTTNVRLESFALMPGSSSGLFRVTANDGTLTASDVSDMPFTVPDNPPSVLIFGPLPEAVFATNEVVILWGQAYDWEDGLLEGDSLVWESSLDGELGRGAQLVTRDLSPGFHILTLTATDSQGQRARMQSAVYIDPEIVLTRASAEEEQFAAMALAGELKVEKPAEDPAAQPAPAAVSLPLWALLAGGAAILALAAALLLALRARRR